MPIAKPKPSLSNIIHYTYAALCAIAFEGELVLDYVDESKITKELLIAAASRNINGTIDYIKKFNNDEEFMLQLLELYPNYDNDIEPFTSFAGAELCGNKKFVLECVKASGKNLKYALVCSAEIALAAVSNYEHALDLLIPEFRTREVCRRACSYSDCAVKYVPAEFLKDKKFINGLIALVPNIISALSKESLSLLTVKDDIVFIEKILKKDIALAKYFPNLLVSKELVLKLVKIDADVLRYCNDFIRNDREIITTGITSARSYSIRYASSRLRRDSELIYMCFAKSAKCNRGFHESLFILMGSNLKTTAFFYRLLENKLITKEQFDKFIKMEVVA